MTDDPQRLARTANLTGLWSGFYAYDLTGETMNFTTWFIETRRALTGTLLEPNTLMMTGPDELDSDIAGFRHGLDVRFDKTLSAAHGIEHPPVRFHGDTDPDFNAISGVWYFDDPSDWTGTFMLTRLSRQPVSRHNERRTPGLGQ